MTHFFVTVCKCNCLEICLGEYVGSSTYYQAVNSSTQSLVHIPIILNCYHNPEYSHMIIMMYIICQLIATPKDREY